MAFVPVRLLNAVGPRASWKYGNFCCKELKRNIHLEREGVATLLPADLAVPLLLADTGAVVLGLQVVVGTGRRVEVEGANLCQFRCDYKQGCCYNTVPVAPVWYCIQPAGGRLRDPHSIMDT